MNLNVSAVLPLVTADSLHNRALNLSRNTAHKHTSAQRAPFWPDGVLSVWREGQGRARSVCVCLCISGFDTLIRADVLLLQWRLPLPPPGLWTRTAVEQRANVCLIPDLSSTPAPSSNGGRARGRQMGAGCVCRGVFMSLEYWLLLFRGKLVEFVFVCGA